MVARISGPSPVGKALSAAIYIYSYKMVYYFLYGLEVLFETAHIEAILTRVCQSLVFHSIGSNTLIIAFVIR